MAKMKMVITSTAFFTNYDKLSIEEKSNTGRTYFLDRKGRIVAVGAPAGEKTENDVTREGKRAMPFNQADEVVS